MKKINVLHIASFNGNIGDNANHNGLRNNLKKYLNVDFNFTEIEMREFYQSWDIRDFNDNNFIELCNEHEMVIIGGGNFFELKWDYSYTGTTVNFKNETLKRIKTPMLFFGLGLDIAKGTNESNIRKFSEFLDEITSSEKYLVTVRNDGSFENLDELYEGRYNDKIEEVIDGAFSMNIPNDKKDYPEIRKGFKSIGLNIAADMKEIRFSGNLSYERYIIKMADILNEFLDENPNFQFILFPHIYSDLEAISELISGIKDIHRRNRIIVAPTLTGTGAENYIFSLYAQCELILGMRFHSNICAIAQGIPTIALNSYKKIEDLYKNLDLEDRIINVNEEGFEEELSKKIVHSLENSNEIKMKYEDVLGKVIEKNDSFYRKVREWTIENKII